MNYITTKNSNLPSTKSPGVDVNLRLVQ